jgi:hypothetical protein
MSENTKQRDEIDRIKGGLDALFVDDPNVFTAGDLSWYPVRGHPEISAAPDAMVVFGRPKGHRRSYKQWEEGGIAPQVVFEILSPSNTPAEMVAKHLFYERHGVEEYYLFDPDTGELGGWLRKDGRLAPIERMEGWVSPRLGVRFQVEGQQVHLYRRDGTRFESYVELFDRGARTEVARKLEEARRRRAEQERQRAEQERQRAEAELARERARAERLAARLREAGLTDE